MQGLAAVRGGVGLVTEAMDGAAGGERSGCASFMEEFTCLGNLSLTSGAVEVLWTG